jgi:hypothetical protein
MVRINRSLAARLFHRGGWQADDEDVCHPLRGVSISTTAAVSAFASMAPPHRPPEPSAKELSAQVD